MNVMTYDFHGDWEHAVGHNSPLFPLNSATGYHKKLTVVSGNNLNNLLNSHNYCDDKGTQKYPSF